MKPLSIRSPYFKKFLATFATASILFSVVLPQISFASEEEDECPEVKSIDRAITEYELTLTRSISDTFKKSTEQKLEVYKDKRVQAEIACGTKKASREATKNKCLKKAKDSPDVWKWDDDKRECVDKTVAKSNPNSGECNDAEIARGALRGENCKAAASTIKDVQVRGEALGQTAMAATQAYSTMQAMQSTGFQEDVQLRQQKIMTGLAAMKIMTGAVALQGAASLKSAASDATEASENISGAYKGLIKKCAEVETPEKLDSQQCFYKYAHEQGVDPSQKSYATFDRLKHGGEQSQEQADRANALAKTSMVTGAADTLVGLQALYMARQAGQNAAFMAPPPMPPAQTMLMNPMTGGSGSQGLGAIGAAPFDNGPAIDGGPMLGGATGGNMAGGLVKGAPMGVNTYKAQHSTVSGGGGSLGGGGGGSGRSKSPGRRKSSPRNTTSGEYSLAGGGPLYKGGNGDKDAAAAANPLADILGKLFPTNQDGKPVVDGRNIASYGEPTVDDPEQAAGVTVSELSLFEQIKSRYRVLNGSGRI
jgi:hypothetical protein